MITTPLFEPQPAAIMSLLLLIGGCMTELVNVLNVLVRLEGAQTDFLSPICDGPLVPANRFTKEEA